MVVAGSAKGLPLRVGAARVVLVVVSVAGAAAGALEAAPWVAVAGTVLAVASATGMCVDLLAGACPRSVVRLVGCAAAEAGPCAAAV